MENSAAVLETICYSDLFDFPMTEREIWQYLIARKPMTKTECRNALQQLVRHQISYNAPYYYLKGRKKIIAVRKRRKIVSLQKLTQVQSLTKWFSFIPTVRYVGISGSLARLNAEESDDIDLFVIAEAKTVWITRLMLLGLLQILGKRRKRGEAVAQDKICLNFLLDTQHLAFSEKRHEVYTAYEIAQLRCLYDTANTYNKFLLANEWIKNILPHFSYEQKFLKGRKNLFLPIFCFIYSQLEPIVRLFQLWIIRRHQTSEVVNAGIAAFHPHDYRSNILHRFTLLASEKKSVASESNSLWGIDKAKPIIYTRKDCTISPNIPLERFSFKNL